RLLRRLRAGGHRAVRRRPVRARRRPRPDPVARIPLPRRCAERCRTRRVQRGHAGRRAAGEPAAGAVARRLPLELRCFRGKARDGYVACLAEDVPRGAFARLAAADEQVPHVEMEVRGLPGALGDQVDVEIERARRGRMRLEPQRRLLECLAQRRGLERDVGGLDVPAGLQQPAQLRVRDETRTRAAVVDDERRSGEVRARLIARCRPLELSGQPEHRATIRLLALVGCDVGAQKAGEVHSYCSACSTLRRAARRAGKIAAIKPAMIAAITNTISVPHGIAIVNDPSASPTRIARPTPSGMPSAAPISAVTTLSWRIIRRVWRRVIPTARNMPSSRVRSNTESTSVFTIPKRLTTIESERSTYSRFRNTLMPDSCCFLN